MTLHRMDLPDAPVRVHESRLTPGTWLWRCLDAPLHHSRGYANWDEAWDAMEAHRVAEHAVADALHIARSQRGRQVMAAVVGSFASTVTYTPRSKP